MTEMSQRKKKTRFEVRFEHGRFQPRIARRSQKPL